MSKKKLSYSVKFKLTVVEECSESGLSRRDVAKNYGLNEEEEVVGVGDILNNNILNWTDYELPEPELSPIGKRRRI